MANMNAAFDFIYGRLKIVFADHFYKWIKMKTLKPILCHICVINLIDVHVKYKMTQLWDLTGYKYNLCDIYNFLSTTNTIYLLISFSSYFFYSIFKNVSTSF